VAKQKKCKVFVSHSRHYEALVKPLAGLLVAMNEAVFLDVTSLSPGDLWEQQIMNGSRCVRLYHLLVLRWQGLRIH
jgi:hypothetical protein